MKKIYTLMLIILSCGLFAQNTWIRTFNPIPGAIDYRPVNLLKFNDEFVFNYNCHIYDYDPEWPEDWYESGIIKLSSTGDLIWQYDTSFENINGIVITEEGDIIASSSSYGSYTLLKLNAGGELLWTYNLNEFQVWSLDNTIDGNAILCGDINSQPAIRKITGDGDEIWTQIYSINQSDEGRLYSIKSNANGQFISTGKIAQDSTMEDALIIKIDENGEELLSNTLDGYSCNDVAYSVAENSNGELLIVGCCMDSGLGYHLFWMINSNGDTLWSDYSERGYNRSVHYNQIDESFLVAGWDFYRVEQSNYEILTTDFSPCGYDKSIIILENNLVFFHQDIWLYLTVCKSNLNGIVSVDNNAINQKIKKICNHPNPFNPSTTIEFSIQSNANVGISIFNIKGQLIKDLVNNDYTKGNHLIVWNGVDENNNSVNSGIYYYKLRINGKTEAVKKCLLLK